MSPQLVRRLSSADRAVGELAGLGRGLPSPELFGRALVRREAVLSSRIEGTVASLSDVAMYEVERPARPRGDVQEVFNYMSAMDHVLDPGRHLPLSLSLLREAHQILMTGVRGDYATPGEFRHSQNWIGPPGSTIETAKFVPPPPMETGSGGSTSSSRSSRSRPATASDALSAWTRYGPNSGCESRGLGRPACCRS
ncbi:Fic family protein [Nocardia fluminea]|uniref:Fic family protein n=1 Tax=Nocardia fluminea TaxID=134984 RepID=UPI003811F7E7